MSDVAYLGPGGRGGRPRPLLRKLVGDVLRRHRLQQRRTLADVARAARVSMPYLSEIERGRKEASSEVLGAVCAALLMDLADLVDAVGRDLAKDTAFPRSRAAAEDRAQDRSRALAEDRAADRAPEAEAAPSTAPAEATASVGAGEQGQLADRAPVISLDAARLRRAGGRPAPARSSDVVLLAA